MPYNPENPHFLRDEKINSRVVTEICEAKRVGFKELPRSRQVKRCAKCKVIISRCDDWCKKCYFEELNHDNFSSQEFFMNEASKF